jgi:PAS domain-containing protein
MRIFAEDKEMELTQFFKSVLDEDRSPVVICNMDNIIIYMNPAACKMYSKGSALLGENVLDCHNSKSKMLIKIVLDWFLKDSSNNRVFMYYDEKHNKDLYMVALRDDNGELIGYYEKHESREREKEQAYRVN